MIPLPQSLRTRCGWQSSCARRLCSSALASACRRGVRAAGDDDDDQAHGRVEPSDDARVGRRDAHARRVRSSIAGSPRAAARIAFAGPRPTAARSINTTNTLEAIEIGLTDMGWVGTLWELSKLPLQNVTFYAPFASDDFRTGRRHRQRDASHRACDDRRVDRAERQVLGRERARYLSPDDDLSRATRVDDLRGRKILAPGPSAAWLEGTGAVAVDGSLTTYYQQIQTGVADGVITILTGAAPNRLHEVAPYITLVGIGSQVTGALAINLDTWNRLPRRRARSARGARARVQQRRRRRDRAALRARASRACAAKARRSSSSRSPRKQKWLAAMPDIATPLDRGDRAARHSRRRGAARLHECDPRARRHAAARLGSTPTSPRLADESMQASNARAPQAVRHARERAQRGRRRLDIRADVPDRRRHHGAHGCSTIRSRASPRWCRCRSSRACSCSSRTQCCTAG